jgi:putative transposase
VIRYSEERKAAVLDLFSRFVLAWMVSRKENSALARQLMNEAAIRYRIGSGQLTVHQDRGAPMIAHRYIDQMTELGHRAQSQPPPCEQRQRLQ